MVELRGDACLDPRFPNPVDYSVRLDLQIRQFRRAAEGWLLLRAARIRTKYSYTQALGIWESEKRRLPHSVELWLDLATLPVSLCSKMQELALTCSSLQMFNVNVFTCPKADANQAFIIFHTAGLVASLWAQHFHEDRQVSPHIILTLCRKRLLNRTQAGYRSSPLLAVHEYRHPWYRILSSGSRTHRKSALWFRSRFHAVISCAWLLCLLQMCLITSLSMSNSCFLLMPRRRSRRRLSPHRLSPRRR